MQKYGLIGYPLGHSFSKNYFNQKFESENIDATYLNFEIPNIKDLKTVLKENPSPSPTRNKSFPTWMTWTKTLA